MNAPFDPILVDSINYLLPEHRDRVIVSGSHGGLYCAGKCLAVRVRGVILNDAGVGRDEAGIAALAACDPHRLPVAVIGNASARIGDARDMLRRGTVSHRNASAAALGVEAGMPCGEAARLLGDAAPEFLPHDAVKEFRHEIPLEDGGEAVVCIDSASLIKSGDAGRVVVTGSHGALIGGDPAKAANVPARFLAFNDAGFGMDDAGAGRLEPLAERGLAAVVVDCMSARIGDGRSTLEDGVVSRANAAARAAGIGKGDRLKEALIEYLRRRG